MANNGTTNGIVFTLTKLIFKIYAKCHEYLYMMKDSLQVDDALSNVRSLASRSKLTSPNVLMAAIETLVEISLKSNDKFSIMYAKAFAICKKYEDSEGLGNLVLKLFGSTEDKKVASVVAEWSKLGSSEFDNGFFRRISLSGKLEVEFDPLAKMDRSAGWVTRYGEACQSSTHATQAEEVAAGHLILTGNFKGRPYDSNMPPSMYFPILIHILDDDYEFDCKV
ncbi:hypothetical protein KUTeg_011178 [Tegillarca granosa]|uniref:Uncharacterized protein n=1 Tax=Tegillarca granosa TaxID=220873 RepID=A0ABQ9F1H9_TEGGR|nr:hypothetical protein KUTeg_011178 [Tegillarca granosa]